MLVACGGGSSNNDTPPPPNQAPVPTITSPAAGATFKAGDTLTVIASASDAEDGALSASRLTWWAELHHDAHTHPFVQPTTGTGGPVTIPTRGETSDNIFYRLHLRATDSAGREVEVTRDVLPQKAQVTLATQPTGLSLTLDGPAVTAPHTFTGVVGVERDIGAADQNFNGRRYRFAGWSQGGAATQTLFTPSNNTTYTATFTDIGPVNNQPPTVSLTVAASGTVGVALPVSATAGDSDGSISQVEFFDGTTSIGVDTTAPYAISWTPTTAGARNLTARATDNGGASTTSSAIAVSVTQPVNQPPTVSVSAAATGTVGVATTVSATAADSDGTVARVEFFEGSTSIGVDTTAPYSVQWTPATQGARSLTARATDSAGASTTSAAVVVNVAAAPVNQPPSVALSATAADSDGSVTQVEFFDGATSLGVDATSPYGVSWTPGAAGTRGITARATDNQGAQTTSSVVNVNVSSGPDTQPPTVSLTAPANLADGLTGTLTITATAGDNVGVAGVLFQIDGIDIGSEDTTAPYQASLSAANFTSGQHVIRARARDAAGNLSPWSQATVRFGGSVNTPAGFTRNDTFVTGLSNATAFAQTPDGRLLVAQQGGALRVVKNGSLLTTPFLQLAVDSAGERGLIGVAVHPNFASNGWVYVYYTTTSGGVHNRISRFVASGDVSTGTETILVDLPGLSGATNHNGGAMHFGADGKLYVGVGDNANGAKAQDLNDPFGKMLRFNDDGSIPSDNPICTTAGNLACAVWARGLRNPFTFAVQPGTGRIHINDVGQGTWEEINLGAAGANYGWPQTEGPTTSAGITAPLLAYRHSDTSPAGSGPGGFFVGFAIAGGAFYPTNGTFPAAYRGNYFFADYVSGFVARVDLANGNAAYAFARGLSSPVDMRVGIDGALYVLTRGGIVRFSSP
jgi:glucose/arabinose dehydrogenase